VLTRGNDNDYSGADQQQREAAEKKQVWNQADSAASIEACDV